jgi:hypothetical protein
MTKSKMISPARSAELLTSIPIAAVSLAMVPAPLPSAKPTVKKKALMITISADKKGDPDMMPPVSGLRSTELPGAVSAAITIAKITAAIPALRSPRDCSALIPSADSMALPPV